jgi:hypothetical protein
MAAILPINNKNNTLGGLLASIDFHHAAAC